MCGISGYILLDRTSASACNLVDMTASIRHRGPDDEGYVFLNVETDVVETYSSPRSPSAVKELWLTLPASQTVIQHHLAMAQVRYSIIDLSPGGHQPMWSPCQQVCLTFNGEIYNYIELREELSRSGYGFRTRSDTEVLMAGYLAWGDQVFAKLNGFYAVILYDRRKKAVLLGRDRLGKAHLYIHRKPGQSVHWASEIKAFMAAGCLEHTSVDPSAVSDYIINNRRDRGGTFWHEVEDFPPGHFAWLDKAGSWKPQRYWGLPQSRRTTWDISPEQAAIGLRDLLSDSLRLRLRADVPVGFELSGGMDSSALVGLAAGHLGEKITTYTIEFEEAHSNEEPFARAVAGRYPDQISYRVIKQPREHFWQEADQYVRLQEEPFHSPNLHTNQFLRGLMKADGAHVVINGAAGDEMLAGYAGDYLGPYLRHLLQNGQFGRFVHEATVNTEIPFRRSVKGLIADLVLSEDQRDRVNRWRTGEGRLLNRVLSSEVLLAPARIRSTPEGKTFHGRTLANMTHRLMNYWLRSSAKSDYGIPIELRAPFLDYRVVEYCCQLPPEYLIRDGWHKHVLRMAVKDYLPDEVVWRRNKMGFPFPYREWLLASRSVAERNSQDIDCPFFNKKALFETYDDFVRVAPVTLWRLLSLMLWWRRVIENKSIFSGE